MQIKKVIVFILLSIFVAVFPQSAHAISESDFGSCLNPQVAAFQVNNGTNHGVVGKNTPYSGIDTIYSFQDGNIMQCLCQDNGEGIQTIWFKVSSYSQEEILFLQSQGWIYVPTGASWGLDDTPYLAKNSNYACKGTGGGSSSSSSSVQGTSSSSTGSVLGLATTGNVLAIYGLFFAGLISFFAGLLLIQGKKNN